MRSNQEKKSFLDFSKTEEGKKIFERNKSFWTNGDFFGHIRALKNPNEIELAQIMRKYQSSFSWIQKEIDHLKAFQIRHTPTIKPEDLIPEIEIAEGYLWLEIIVPDKYPEEAASFVLLNHSISKDIKRLFERDLFDFHIEYRGILKTLKYMDNNLDKIFEKAQALKNSGALIQATKPEQQPQPEKVNSPVKEQKEEKEKEKEKEKIQGGWTQELQKLLEKAIIEFKDIKDPKEKWQKIAEKVPGKTMSECVQRFKDCRKAAEERKNQPEETKIEHKHASSEEEEEDEDESEEEGSEGDSNDSLDNGKEEEKVNRQIRDFQEYESCLDSAVIAKNIRMENVSVGVLVSIQLQASCKDCKCIHELEAKKEEGTEYLLNNEKCPKCAQKSRLVAKQEVFHETLTAICSIGSFTWDIRDLHFCEFDLTCEFCDTANRTKKIIAGQPVYMECKGCFKKMQFSYIALTLTALNIGGGEDGEDDEHGGNIKEAMKKIFSRKNKFEFKVGFPLPNNGSCKHYKGSNRYFRFPCCGKAYPCDDCHNRVEKHEMEELAKNMICGFCSSEQPVGDTCKRCAKAVTKIVRKTAYWEGGKGTRNVMAMSKKDPKKFKGLGKTVSSKQKNKTQGK